MTGWQQNRLEEVVSVWIKGVTPKRSEERYFSEKGGIPFVRVSDLNAPVILDAREHLTPEGEQAAGRSVPKNAVLLSVSGTIGKTAVAGVRLTINQAVQAMVFDEERVLPEYAYYYFQFMREQLIETANTVTIPNLTKTQLENMVIFYPQIREQRRIIELLKHAQDIVQRQKNTGSELEKILHHVMQRKWESAWRELPRISLKEAVTEPIRAGAEEGEFLRAGDLLLRRYRTEEGKTVFLAEEDTPGTEWSAGTFCVRVKEELVRPEFLLFWLRHSFQYLENAPYADKNMLDAASAGAVQIPLVPIKEQDKFAAMVRSVLLMQRKIRKMEQTAQAYYRSMLIYAFLARLTETFRRENELEDPRHSFFDDTYRVRYGGKEEKKIDWQELLGESQRELLGYLSDFQRKVLRIYGEAEEALPVHVMFKRMRKENSRRFRSQSIQDAIAAVKILDSLGFLTRAVAEKIIINDMEVTGADNRALTIGRYEFVRRGTGGKTDEAGVFGD